MGLILTEKNTRILCEDDVIKAVDKHTNEDGILDNDISCILEEVKSVVIMGSKEMMSNLNKSSQWIKCVKGQMPEDFDCYDGKKIINVLVTTNTGKVTKVQRMYNSGTNPYWYWGRIYGRARAWMPLPDPYTE